MPRLSPRELQEAKRARQEEREAMARKRSEEKEQAAKEKARHEQLVSVTAALYDEMDKLNRKAPAMTISQLSLERVNKLIKSAKDLMQQEKDDFVEEIVEFVPAGDMPEYRDVVLVLGQLKAGLDRFRQSRTKYWGNLGVY